MKKLSLLAGLLFIAGCTSANPLTALWPTRKPSSATVDYLGHLYTTNTVNKLYHSHADTKYELLMVDLRKVELVALHTVAKGEIDFVDATATTGSNAAWLGITAILGAAGIMIPRPQEKAKVAEARALPPKDNSKGDNNE